MRDWKQRLTEQLEPVLSQADPRPAISAYHDMPYAVFRYPPEEELAVRRQAALLRTRLQRRAPHSAFRTALRAKCWRLSNSKKAATQYFPITCCGFRS